MVGFPKLGARDQRRLRKLKRMPDSQIDYSEIPEASPRGWRRRNPALKLFDIPLEDDVTAWLTSLGKRGPSRVNAILRQAMKEAKAGK